MDKLLKYFGIFHLFLTKLKLLLNTIYHEAIINIENTTQG